jgi:drug/metabolite transporter (DMT)-like permease
MKSIAVVGVLLVVLGVLSFVVPLPHSDNHSVKIGDAKIGVQTQHSEKLPPAVGVVLLVGGVVALALGARNT